MDHQLERSVTLIGRDPKCDIVVPNEYNRVSREHAEVRREDGNLVLINRSHNGTWINNERIDRRPLREGDQILFGGQAEYRYQQGRLVGPGVASRAQGRRQGAAASRMAPPMPAPRPSPTPYLAIAVGLAIVIAALFFYRLRATDPVEQARNLAHEWTTGDAATTTQQLLGSIGGLIPLEAPILSDQMTAQLGQRTSWVCDEPTKVTNETYRVLCTAHLNFQVLNDASYDVTAPFQLTVDTQRGEIRQSQMVDARVGKK